MSEIGDDIWWFRTEWDGMILNNYLRFVNYVAFIETDENESWTDEQLCIAEQLWCGR